MMDEDCLMVVVMVGARCDDDNVAVEAGKAGRVGVVWSHVLG
jgi:hypothetical protein